MSPVRRCNNHDPSQGGVALGCVDARADEEDEVHKPHKTREDGDGEELGAHAAVAVRVVVAVDGLLPARVPARARRVVVVVDGEADKGRLDATDDGRGHPDQQRHGDVGARVDAGLAFAEEPGHDFGDVPDEGDEENGCAQDKGISSGAVAAQRETNGNGADAQDNVGGVQGELGVDPGFHGVGDILRLLLLLLKLLLVLLLLLELVGGLLGEGRLALRRVVGLERLAVGAGVLLEVRGLELSLLLVRRWLMCGRERLRCWCWCCGW